MEVIKVGSGQRYVLVIHIVGSGTGCIRGAPHLLAFITALWRISYFIAAVFNNSCLHIEDVASDTACYCDIHSDEKKAKAISPQNSALQQRI